MNSKTNKKYLYTKNSKNDTFYIKLLRVLLYNYLLFISMSKQWRKHSTILFLSHTFYSYFSYCVRLYGI